MSVLMCWYASPTTFADTSQSAPSAPARTHPLPPTSAPAAEATQQPPQVLNRTWVNGVPLVTPSAQGQPQAVKPPQPPSIVSQAAVVMDMNTGTLVYAKNPLTSHYPASITKIMTALLALQHGQLTDEIRVSKEAADQPPDKLYFVPGESEPLQSMLYGLLLISANDAAVAIAQQYGGSVAGFADMMNHEAVTLGATHTHFVNPNGLPNPNHVTTAYDMALIARAAMQYPEFRKLVATKSYEWKGQAWQSNLTNINRMLYNYPGCIGIKTGYTSVAHETLAVAASRGKDTFLAILMDAPTNYAIQHDATSLLNFAFANYHSEVLVQPGQVVSQIHNAAGRQIPLHAGAGVIATVANNSTLHVSSRLLLRKLTPAAAATRHVYAADLLLSVPGQPDTSLPVETHVPLSLPAIATATTKTQHVWRNAGETSVAVIVFTGLALRRRKRRRRRLRYESLTRRRVL